MPTGCPAGDRLSPTPRRVRFPQSTRTPRRSNETPMARSPLRRFILVGGALAVAAAGAYVKRDRVRQLLPGTSSDAVPQPYSPPAPAPSNYDAPGPPANTATPIPAPDPVVSPEPGRSEPVENFPVQADDPQAAAAAVDAAAADALAEGIGAVDEPGLQGAPEPIDEAAEEQAAAAEAAAIGGPAADHAGPADDEASPGGGGP